MARPAMARAKLAPTYQPTKVKIMPKTTKALDLFKEGGRPHILEGRYVVQATPITLEHTDACSNQRVVQARLPGDSRESWGTDIPVPGDVHLLSVEELDKAVLDFFNRWPDALAPCPACGTMTWNRKHFHSAYRDEKCGDCWFKAFDEEMEKMRLQDLDEQRQQDIAQYHNGMRYRTSAVIHPKNGDDFFVDLFTAERLTTEQARAELRRKYRDAALIEVAPIYQLPSH
jgi:hypothetical protein